MNCLTANDADDLIPPERVKFFEAHGAALSIRKILHTLPFWLLFDHHMPDVALRERYCENPIARRVLLVHVFELGAIVVALLLLLAHVIDTDHVAVADEHIHREVQNTRIEAEVFCNAFMDDPTPSFNFLLFHCAETDSISP